MPTSVPEGWRRLAIKEMACQRAEKIRPSRDDQTPYVALEHIPNGGGRLLGVDVAGSAMSHKTRFLAGDTLFGKLRPNLRKVVRARFDGVCSTDILAVTPKDGTDAAFLYQLLASDVIYRHVMGDITGTKMPRTSWERLADLSVSCPPLPEQRTIAAVLDAIDDAIERTEGVIAATEELRRALLHDLLTRGVPGWHSEWKHVPGLGTVPACWDVTTLGEVGQWTSGGTPSKDREDYWSGPIPWISAKDMKVREIWDATDRISEEGARAGSRIVPEGTVLMVVRGMILAHSFPVAIARVPCAFNQDLKAVVCRPDIFPDYLLAVLDSRRRRLLDLPTTSTHGTMRIISDELFSIPVPVPPEQEQRCIADLLGAIDLSRAAERDRVSETRALKATLTDALLTGRVRAPVAAEVSA